MEQAGKLFTKHGAERKEADSILLCREHSEVDLLELFA